MYGNKGFSYVFEGNDANAFPTHGYLWDAAARAGLTLRNYGEFVGVSAELSPTKLTLEEGAEGALKGNTCPFYPGFDLGILDNARVDVFLKEFRGFVKAKEMPRLTILRLGNDHTAGTKKGERTPRAMVAENDVALGRLVEAISHSPFWKETAIFVIEDDAQSGSDHVDAHRTVGFVISPFTRRKGFVDSTMYSTVSMLRTMELLLGLPPLSQHDASATPMTNAFADAPDLAPLRPPRDEDPVLRDESRRRPDAGRIERMGLLEGGRGPGPRAQRGDLEERPRGGRRDAGARQRVVRARAREGAATDAARLPDALERPVDAERERQADVDVVVLDRRACRFPVPTGPAATRRTSFPTRESACSR